MLSFSAPAVTRDGRAYFVGLTSRDRPNAPGRVSQLWMQQPSGGFRQVVGSDQAFVDRPGQLVGDILEFVTDGNGHFVFRSSVDGEPAMAYAGPDGARVLARPGDPIPNAPGGQRFGRHYSAPLINPSGRAAFRTQVINSDGTLRLAGGIVTGQLIRHAPGTIEALQPVLLVGDPIETPDPGSDGVVLSVNAAGLNDAGDFYLSAGVQDATGTPQTILRARPGVIETLVATDDPAPGAEPGTRFSGFGSNSDPYFGVSNAGVAFSARTENPGADPSTSNGAWVVHGAAAPDLILRTGEPIPGYDPPTDGFVPRSALMNERGDIVAQDRSVWLFRDEGTVVPVIQHRVPIEAFGETRFPFLSDVGRVNLNAQGQTSFLARLAPTNFLSFDTPQALLAGQPDGTIISVVMEGLTIDVDDDPAAQDLRTIREIEVLYGSGGNDGRRTALSDTGELVFKLEFTDGTEGIFSAVVPEPALVAALLAALPAWRVGRHVGCG